MRRLKRKRLRLDGVSVVLAYATLGEPTLRAFLRDGAFSFEDRPHMAWQARRPGVVVQAYHSGKLVVSGAQADEYARVLVANRLATGAPRAHDPAAAEPLPLPHAGSDESGKGDYFGALVTACVFVPDEATARALVAQGVRDSKQLAPGQVGPLASLVRARCPHRIVALPPPTYNARYTEFGSLNKLLAWAHARAIEDLLAETGPTTVLVDRFAEGVLARHLMERGRSANVVERVRAESDVAVAAASVVARAEFVASIAALEARHGVRLPLGAGPPVKRAIGAIPRDVLPQVAKMHFAM